MRYKILILILVFYSSVFSEEKKITSLKKPAVYSSKYFDVNRIVCSVHNDGVFARHPISGNSDFKFDDDYLIYTSGLWLSAKVNGEIRASAADFLSDWIGGAVDESGNPFGKQDSTFRVYKISRGDNAATNPDYAQCPSQFGAPTDTQGNPLILGDQTLWCSFTDAYLENREYNPCPPLGAEVHLTVWGLADSMRDVMFLRWEFFNKSEDLWQDAYAGFFIDPDIGFTNNNLVGSDSSLSLVYSFEHTNYQKSDSSCAVGYVLLEPPVMASSGDTALTLWGPVIDFKNVEALAPMVYKHNPYEWGLPQYRNDYARTWIYRRLAGQDTAGNAMINPLTEKKTKWGLSGDPVSETGWIDELPQDRFMMISTGPVDVLRGETNAMTMAIVAVRDTNYFGTIPKLKERSAEVHTFFRKEMKKLTGIQADYSSSNQINSFQLYQNYPNLFNSITSIRFSLDKPTRVSLKIYNILGQEIVELVDKELASCIHAIQWDGKNDTGQQVGSGLYFARLTNRNQTKLVKMVLIR